MNIDRSAPAIPLSVFGRAFKLLWEELFLLGLAGYAWILFSALLLPLAPMTVGVFYVTNQVAHGNAIGFKTQFVGARRFLGRSLIWGLINLIAGLLIWADLRYYQGLSGNAGVALVTLAGLLALAWSVVQVFTLPFLIEAGPAHLRVAFKQAFILVVSQPLFVLGLMVVTAGLLLACWYLPILIGYGLVYVALTVNLAVITLTESRSGENPLSSKLNRTAR